MPADSFERMLAHAVPLTQSETVALSRRLSQGGDSAVKQAMVTGHLRLVAFAIQKYFRAYVNCVDAPLEKSDLFQEGVIGLLHACEKYDPAIGTRFSTYAIFWIRQSIGRALINEGDGGGLPEHLHQSLREAIAQKSSRPLRAKVRGLDETQWQEIESGLQRESFAVRHLAGAIGFLSILPDEKPEDNAAIDFSEGQRLRLCETQSAVREAVAALPLRQRRVMILHYGLQGGVPQTFECIAQQMNLSRQRVSQIHKKSLELLADLL